MTVVASGGSVLGAAECSATCLVAQKISECEIEKAIINAVTAVACPASTAAFTIFVHDARQSGCVVAMHD